MGGRVTRIPYLHEYIEPLPIHELDELLFQWADDGLRRAVIQ